MSYFLFFYKSVIISQIFIYIDIDYHCNWHLGYTHNFSIIALVYSVVLDFPPTSPVKYFPYLITLKTADSILSP
jgi:hypothetical protein